MADERCPNCGYVVPREMVTCPNCSRGISDEMTAPTLPRTGSSPLARLCWGLTLLVSLGAGGCGLVGVVSANGAPQEAAAASVAVMVIIAAYVATRAIDELTR